MPRTPRNKQNKKTVIIEDVKEPEPEQEPSSIWVERKWKKCSFPRDGS